MSDPAPERESRRRRLGPTIFAMWGRETVKDLTLLMAAIPVLVCIVYVPVLATSGGSWLRLLGLFLLFTAIWVLLRVLLRRWVAAGDRGWDSPSRG